LVSLIDIMFHRLQRNDGSVLLNPGIFARYVYLVVILAMNQTPATTLPSPTVPFFLSCWASSLCEASGQAESSGALNQLSRSSRWPVHQPVTLGRRTPTSLHPYSSWFIVAWILPSSFRDLETPGFFMQWPLSSFLGVYIFRFIVPSGFRPHALSLVLHSHIAHVLVPRCHLAGVFLSRDAVQLGSTPSSPYSFIARLLLV
jgi:hypothetical protein